MNELVEQLRQSGVKEDELTDVTILLQAVELIKRLSEETAVLLDRVDAADRLREDAESDRAVLENKLVAMEHDMQAALTATSVAEIEVQRLAAENETMRREHRLMARDRDECESRLATELASWDRIKADWADRETKYQESFRSQLVANRELKSESAMMDRQLTQNLEEHQAASVIALQTVITGKDKSVMELQRRIDDLELQTFDLSSRLKESSARISSLNSEILELREQNDTLMEDQDSYQILLRERTLTGEFMNSAIMSSMQGSSPPGRSSLSDELGMSHTPLIIVDSSAASTDVVVVQKKDEEIKALTLYISKILSRVLNDDELEARMLNDRISVTTPARRTPLRSVDGSASLRTSHRTSSPNRHRSGLRAASPARPQQAAIRPTLPNSTASGRKGRPLLSVRTSEGPSSAFAPLSAPPMRTGTDFPRGAADQVTVPLKNRESRDGDEARVASTDSNQSGRSSSDDYVAPAAKGPSGEGVLTGFVRRISNALASLKSPVPAEDGVKKELPLPIEENDAVVDA